MIKDKAVGAATLPSNLIGGAIGFLIFTAVGYPGLGNYLHLQPTPGIQLADVLIIAPLALLGIVLALVAGAFFRIAAAAFGRFDDQVILRALIGGAIFSVVGVFAPIVMFSGESEVQTLVADPASYGAATLLLMAMVKLACCGRLAAASSAPTFRHLRPAPVALAIGLLFRRRPHRRRRRLPDRLLQRRSWSSC
jgi:H+/Cl- antiporter ClcA